MIECTSKDAYIYVLIEALVTAIIAIRSERIMNHEPKSQEKAKGEMVKVQREIFTQWLHPCELKGENQRICQMMCSDCGDAW